MNKEVINGVREYYDLPRSVTDYQIESELKGSLGCALVNLRIAKRKLSTCIKGQLFKGFIK